MMGGQQGCGIAKLETKGTVRNEGTVGEAGNFYRRANGGRLRNVDVAVSTSFAGALTSHCPVQFPLSASMQGTREWHVQSIMDFWSLYSSFTLVEFSWAAHRHLSMVACQTSIPEA